jgi:hypothetical protein
MYVNLFVLVFVYAHLHVYVFVCVFLDVDEREMRGFMQAVSISNEIALRLAINTAQLGRTFQDRSHVVDFVKRPTAARRERDVEAKVETVASDAGSPQQQKRSAMDLSLSNRPKRAAHAATMFAGRC